MRTQQRRRNSARLIAAAPDLLACLENLARLAKIEDDNFGNGALSLGSYEVGLINAAITKATGADPRHIDYDQEHEGGE